MRASTCGSMKRAPGEMVAAVVMGSNWLHLRHRHRHELEQLVDDLVRGDAFRLGVEVEQHPMPEHRMGQGRECPRS